MRNGDQAGDGKVTERKNIMKKKLVLMLLATSLATGLLFGCGDTKNSDTETKQETTGKTEKTEEEKKEDSEEEKASEAETSEVGEDTLGIAGNYSDEVSGRAVMEVLKDTEDQYYCMINWGAGASETAVWTIKGAFDEASKTLTYTDGTYTVISWTEDGTENTSEPETTSGSLTIEGDKIRWKDSKNSEDGLFAKESGEEMAGVENPWTETDSIDDATKGANVYFEPPVTEALPEIEDGKFTLAGYRYSEGVVEAVYTTKDHELVIRKSNTMSQEELPGVFYEYEENWEENFKGLVVSCKGKNGLSSVATYGVGSENYSITLDPDDDSFGLTSDQLSSLIMGMQ